MKKLWLYLTLSTLIALQACSSDGDNNNTTNATHLATTTTNTNPTSTNNTNNNNNNSNSNTDHLSAAQAINNVNVIMMEFKNCKENSSEQHSCQTYTSKAICSMYGIDDLITSEGTYTKIYEIRDAVSKNRKWRRLGTADDNMILTKAMELANQNKSVIAINATQNFSHVAIILPGPGMRSTSWGGMVPNAATFFHHNPQKSFTNKTLNYVWGKPDGVELWAREG